MGVSHLSSALEQNNVLERLDVSYGRNVGDSHILALMPGLAVNKGLKKLDISFTRVSETGLNGILSLLKQQNVYLEEVRMTVIGNKFTSLKQEIDWWLAFNRHGRRVIHDKNASRSDLLGALFKMSSHETLGIDFSFELLRAKPELFVG